MFAGIVETNFFMAIKREKQSVHWNYFLALAGNFKPQRLVYGNFRYK